GIIMNDIHSHKIHLFCVIAYIAIMPLSFINVAGMGSAYKVASIALVSFMFIQIASDKLRYRWTIPKSMKWWLVYVVYSIISLTWNNNPAVGLTFTIGLVQI